MKNKFNIVYIVLILFLIPISVSAKKTIKTCYYNNGYTGTSEYRLLVTIKIYDDYSASAVVENFAGENIDNKEDVLNWDDYKQKFIKNKKCIKYVSVVNKWGINGTKLWVGNDKDKINKPDGALVAPLTEIMEKEKEEKKSEEQKEKDKEKMDNFEQWSSVINNDTTNYYEVVEKATNHLNEVITNYKTGDCINEDAFTTKYTDCKTIIENLNTWTNEYEKKVNELVNNGNVEENDNRVINFRNTVEESKKVVSDANALFSEYSDYWNYQMNSDVTIEDLESNPESEKTKGCTIFGEKTTKLIKWVYNLIKIGAPLLAIIFGILDFSKSLINGEDKGFKEAWKNFVKRLVAAVIVILLPVLLTFILNISGALKQYGINTEDDIYCIFK